MPVIYRRKPSQLGRVRDLRTLAVSSSREKESKFQRPFASAFFLQVSRACFQQIIERYQTQKSSPTAIYHRHSRDTLFRHTIHNHPERLVWISLHHLPSCHLAEQAFQGRITILLHTFAYI